ncbi:Pterin deaminase [Halomonadaceae bacterium LMG 33818]|uniref:hypothetical protein n=1 Tax=Cernens ardua TaxID=3402176 RepID=UPI003EDC533B
MNTTLTGLRLPRWLLGNTWPTRAGEPLLARLETREGRFTSLVPDTGDVIGDHHFGGALALPPTVEAHCHLDKAFSRPRLGQLSPGLLSAIDATTRDRQNWTAEDLHQRAERALEHAWHSGVRHLRTHIDWWEDTAPVAWNVIAELAQAWQSRMHIERVALVPLPLYADKTATQRIVQQIAQSQNALLGGFVHSSNIEASTLKHLVGSACEQGIPLDLHVDEELNPDAQGVALLAELMQQHSDAPPLCIGHACALAAMPRSKALNILDSLAKSNISLVTLPTSNLLLQDAETGKTPLQRGLTLYKEARARDIPVMIASDNVQDAFYPYGQQDPLEAFQLAVPTLQLENPFDEDSKSLCHTPWLKNAKDNTFTLIGSEARLLVFETTEATTWPAAPKRSVMDFSG